MKSNNNQERLRSIFILFLPACLLLAVVSIIGPAARAAEENITFEVRHDHAIGSCRGALILSDSGVSYQTDHRKDARSWKFEDIAEWRIESDKRLRIFTYEDRKWRLGADKPFEFELTAANANAEQLYAFLKSHTNRPIAAWLAPTAALPARYEFTVKHQGTIVGNQGRLIFTDAEVIYRSADRQASRTWRYEDLESIASAGIYDLTLSTYEQEKFHYASRRVYNFQLKEALPRETYDELWRFVIGKKGLAAVSR